MMALYVLLLGWAVAAPAPPVPIPELPVPEMPAVAVESTAVPVWRVTRVGSHTARMSFVLHHGRQHDEAPVTLRLLQRVIEAELREGVSRWKKVGVEVQWSIGASSSRWIIDGIDGTKEEDAVAAVQTLVRPELAPERIARVQEQWMKQLHQEPNRLNRVHGAAVSQVERGVGEPMLRRLAAEDVKRIAPDDVQAAHRRLLEGGLRGVVIVSGADEEDWVERVLAVVLGAVPVSVAEPTLPRKQRASSTAAHVLVDHPAGELAMITVTVPLADDLDPLATRMAAAVMGGGFESRLNRALREDAGLSYAATARVVGQYARIATTVSGSDVGRAVTVIREVLDAEQPIEEAEVQAVRRGMQRAAIHEMRLSASMSANHADALARGEGVGMVGDHVRAIARLPDSAVIALGGQIWRKEERVWVVTGNADRIGALLDSARWHPTHRLDAEMLWSASTRQ